MGLVEYEPQKMTIRSDVPTGPLLKLLMYNNRRREDPHGNEGLTGEN